MRLILLLIALALIAAPTAALASSAANPSAVQVAAKKKPKPPKNSKKPKKAKKTSASSRSGGSTAGERREAKGPIVSLSPVTVGTLACRVPTGRSIAGFVVGDVVELKCDLVNGIWTLRKLEREDDAPAAAPGTPAPVEEVEVKGAIVSLTPLRVGSTTCAVPAGMSLTSFEVGQQVELECRLVAGVLTVTKLEREDAEDDNGGDRSGSAKGSGGDRGNDDSGSGGDDD